MLLRLEGGAQIWTSELSGLDTNSRPLHYRLFVRAGKDKLEGMAESGGKVEAGEVPSVSRLNLRTSELASGCRCSWWGLWCRSDSLGTSL